MQQQHTIGFVLFSFGLFLHIHIDIVQFYSKLIYTTEGFCDFSFFFLWEMVQIGFNGFLVSASISSHC